MRFKTARKAEVVIAASIAAILIIFLFLGAAGATQAGGAWLHYYANALGGSLSGFLYSAIFFICLLAIMLVIWTLGGSFLVLLFPKWFGGATWAKKVSDPRKMFVAAISRSREVLLIIPAILFLALAGVAMGEANEFARARLADIAVIGWEHALFGTYVFAALGAIRYPHWLIEFIIFSFRDMSLILVGVGVVLAYTARQKFHELLIAFCIGILMMIPIWLLVPVLSPQDRFINNVYGLSMPPAIAVALAAYHPQLELAAFLASVRNDKAGLPAFPTSTMPSAHAFWAALAGWYLFAAAYGVGNDADGGSSIRRAGKMKTLLKWLAWLTLPFLLASTFGTVLLAQHYFIDVPAGLAIAAIAAWMAKQVEEGNIYNGDRV